MGRADDLNKIFESVEENKRDLIKPLIEQVVFIEDQLRKIMDIIRSSGFVVVHPTRPQLQKQTPAAKQYKELMQTYNNAIKVLNSVLGRDAIEQEDEFDIFIKKHATAR